MPGSGTPFNSFALPYRIRVDAFTELPPTERQPAMYLLTHTHTDHLSGLSSKSFSSTVYCSRDAKEMLLQHQARKNRELYRENIRAEKERTFSHLKVDPVMKPDGSEWFVGARDLLKTLPLNTPTPIELEHGEEVTLTLLDANHCHGAVMFLIEGRQGAVLHTGDLRAEPWFLESLARNPYLQPYLAPQSAKNEPFVTKTLEAIYLDTVGAFDTAFAPTKEHATTGLIDLLKCYPADTYFFINAWTWGYEDVLKSIARAFQCQIHVDRYKFSVYQRISDPFLQSIITLDASSTRFHACERYHRCEYVVGNTEPDEYDVLVKNKKGNQVVYVDPVPIVAECWNIYLEDTKKAIRTTGEVVNTVLVPLARHSPLPELQAFVRLFRPKRVIPNCLDPRLRGLDWVCIDYMFETCLSPSSSSDNKLPPTPLPFNIDTLALQIDEECDPAIKNIAGSSDVVSRWAGISQFRNKLEIMVGFLDPGKKSFLDKLLKIRPGTEVTMYEEKLVLRSPDISRGVLEVDTEGGEDHRVNEDGSDDDSDREDDHWRTAEALFGDAVAEEERLYSKAYGNTDEEGKSQHDPEENAQEQEPIINANSDTRWNMTPPMSPFQRSGRKRTHEEDNLITLPRKRLAVEPNSQALGSPIHFHRTLRSPTGSKSLSSYSTEGHQDHVQIDARRQELATSHQHEPRNQGTSSPQRRERRLFVTDAESVSNLRHSPLSKVRRQAHPSDSQRSSPNLRRDENVFVPRTEPRHRIPSPSTEATICRKRARIERTRQSLELAEKLARVNPKRVVSTYYKAREKLLRECARNEVKVQYLEALRRSNVQNIVPDPFFVNKLDEQPVDRTAEKSSTKGGKRETVVVMEEFQTVEGSQLPVDWKKSEGLAEKVRKAVAMGRRPGTVIPPLVCTDDW